LHGRVDLGAFLDDGGGMDGHLGSDDQRLDRLAELTTTGK